MKEKEAIVVALEEQTNNVQEENSVVEEEVQIRNSPSVHSCAACDKRLGSNNDLERHISDKHNEVECPFCQQIFPNRNALKGHVNNCIDNGTVQVKCSKCKQTFTSFGLKRHKKAVTRRMNSNVSDVVCFLILQPRSETTRVKSMTPCKDLPPKILKVSKE